MDRIPLKAQEREILGKKVRQLRRDGFIPGHVFGRQVEGENVVVPMVDFLKVYKEVGETGLIDLRIGAEKVRPVLIREVQIDAVHSQPLHIDFYQVNLSQKVKVTVPIHLIGDEPEKVHTGEAVVIQPINEVEVEALPTDLPESLEVDITPLKEIDDAITVAQLQVPAGVELMADAEAVVVKLDTAVTAEMEQLLEEQQAEVEAAAEAAEEEVPAEGEQPEGEVPAGGEVPDGGETKTETSEATPEDQSTK
ncbi:50S ribosomal protein L25 [Candidatus Daviesbacteria bacterium]|nr:50S ribosomal protein L25 [Candidatus Daviesbacteria bacterium]